MKATIYSNDFNRLINATKAFCSVDSKVTPCYHYIRLVFDAEKNMVTATALDGYRVSIEHCVISDCDCTFTAFIKPNIKLPLNKYAIFTIEENTLIIRCEDFIIGYEQHEEFKSQWILSEKTIIPNESPTFRIRFNGNYLMSALNAAKVSAGNLFNKPVTLEFYGENLPAVLRTNKEDIKIVLPIRIRN